MMPDKVAYTYWHQGQSDAPPIVRACIAQLRCLNPDWAIHVLDRESVGELVSKMLISGQKFERLSLAHQSDLIRTKLLIDNGGVWVDPTVYVSQPFSDWIPPLMSASLFLYSNPGRDRLISNWFIVSEPNNAILSRLYHYLCEYWECNDFRNTGRSLTKPEFALSRVINRNLLFPSVWFSWPFRRVLKIFPYMVYHYLFCHLIKKEADLNEEFRLMPRVSADGPHRLQRHGLCKKFDADAEVIFNDPAIPLHKLTWKLGAAGAGDGTVFDHILNH